nr:hypothetical protein BdHM001_19780 [Bdellovibrio sp. HM001]
MSKILVSVFLILTSLGTSAAEKIDVLTGRNVLTGESQEFAFASSPATVVVFMSAKCPCSASHEGLLKDLSQQFKTFKFVAIHSNADEDADITKAHFQDAHLTFPVLADSRSHWADKLGALKTPHVYVFNSTGDIVYQGGVTDSHVGPSAKKHYLKEVLEDLQASKTPRHKEGRALGCYIQRAENL